MAIGLEFYTLVVRREPVESFLKEEIYCYENDLRCSPASFRCDKHLVAVGAMAAQYLEKWMKELEGLRLKRGEDFDVIDWLFSRETVEVIENRSTEELTFKQRPPSAFFQITGKEDVFSSRRKWLEVGSLKGIKSVWLKGAEPGPVAKVAFRKNPSLYAK